MEINIYSYSYYKNKLTIYENEKAVKKIEKVKDPKEAKELYQSYIKDSSPCFETVKFEDC